MKEKNVFQKLQACRVELQKMNLKKTGKNAFAGFQYYDLGDFLPKVNELFEKNGLSSVFCIETEVNEARLTIVNSDNTTDFVIFRSPVADANIKGCTPIQSLGGVHTYLKRYLYMNALEIVENDMFDAKVGDMEISKKTVQKATPAQIKILEKVYQGANLEKLLSTNKIKKLEDLPIEKASKIVSQLKSKEAENGTNQS